MKRRGIKSLLKIAGDLQLCIEALLDPINFPESENTVVIMDILLTNNNITIII